jgi:F-type H+-transporting ATPase subunit epsilon
MANTFRLEIVTPTGVILDDQIVHVRCPGAAGDFGVLAGHAAMMAGLTSGRLGVDFADHYEDFAITGGYLEVHNNVAIVLAESCINRKDINIEEARQELQRAQQAIEAAANPKDHAIAQAELSRAKAKVYVAQFQRNS